MTPREDDPHRQSTAEAVRVVHRAMWRLLLRSTFERSGDAWIVARTVASTW